MVRSNNKKGQSFSADILVVVIVLLFGVLFLVVNQVKDESSNTDNINQLVEKADTESKIIVEELKNNEIIDSENNVNINNLKQVDLQELKEQLSIKGDFCIVLEKDGNLVKIDAENNVNGIGSKSIIVNGNPCQSS